MKLSLNWLSDHLDISSYTPETLADLLTFAGVEVEDIVRQGVPSELIVVAQILSATPHPNADKLKVCEVDTGASELRQIVCGARNYTVGDKVPCALPGADLGNGFVIQVGKLRGVESKGMLCAASEIGLPEEEDGLLILAPDAPLGTPLTELYSGDTIFDLEVTPNRPDCLSYLGMAREIGAIIARRPTSPKGYKPREHQPASSGEIELQDQEACPFFTTTLIEGVKVKPSPAWLAKKLEATGLTPVNNVVDITNYVLHETGQPLHAYDADRIGEQIIVRGAREGEKFTGLGDTEYLLHRDDCLISDETGRPLALAGILGGAGSSVTDQTCNVLLEAAYFSPSRIRRSARRQGNLTTDSSYRFERSVDYQSITRALGLAISLLVKETKGTAGPTKSAGSCPPPLPAVPLPERLLAQVTGGDLPLQKAEDHLRALGLIAVKSGGTTAWGIPAYRQDLRRPIDLIEEVVRLEGFDQITPRLTSGPVLPSKEDRAYDAQLQLKGQLAAGGYYECNTLKLLSHHEAAQSLTAKPLREGDLISVALPLTEDHDTMRPSLSAGLLSSAARNARQGAKSFRFFELGRVFRNAGGGKAKDLEAEHLGLLLGGTRHPKGWLTSEDLMTAFDLKGILGTLVPQGTIQLRPKAREGYLLGAEIHLDGKSIGAFAQLSPKAQRTLDFPAPIYLAEIELSKLLAHRTQPRQARALEKYPGSSRDVAFEAPLAVSAAQIEALIVKKREPLLVDFTCFDLFHDLSGAQLAADKKSLAYRFEYRSPEKSLKAKEVDEAHQGLLSELCEKLGLQTR